MSREFRAPSDSQPLVREANFLETLLVTHSNVGPEMISDLLNDLLLGAIDTTSSTFSFIIYNLAKNPECQEKVYEEISRVVLPDEPVTPEVLQMLPYLKACVKESGENLPFKLFPTIDGTSRILDKNITLSGYNIPANSIIRIHAVAGMMSEYVPEPEKFQPERWLRAADRSILANPYLTITFGVGFRGCLGKRFAEQQIHTGLVKLLQNFRFEWHREDISLDFKITSRPSSPMQPKVFDRS
ncbi:putative cytochrome P450 10 [Apostichopus japonicus]|uniref:Putative cytochrome P450 10 n=1 Tax=Stichopus japonicus TaxID=307972 RepID=A0A2G8JFC7_STIJA|nr:putative cytochrome P450 10 [Apostichopus japonicus]